MKEISKNLATKKSQYQQFFMGPFMRCSYRLLENKFQDVGETLILNTEMHVSYISFVFLMYSVSGALVGLANGS
jgi:hypothetical protein